MAPPLPPLPIADWPAGINRAYNTISDAYERGRELLQMEDTPLLRYSLTIERMQTLHQTYQAIQNTGVAPAWANELQHTCERLLVELKQAEEQTRNL